jgi:hypothetical protein
MRGEGEGKKKNEEEEETVSIIVERMGGSLRYEVDEVLGDV